MFSMRVVIFSLYLLCMPIAYSKPLFGLCDLICDDDSSSSDDDDDDWDLCSGCSSPHRPPIPPIPLTPFPTLTTQVLLPSASDGSASSNLRINGTQSNGITLVPGYWQFVPYSERPAVSPNQPMGAGLQRPQGSDSPPGSVSQFTGLQPQQLIPYYPGQSGPPGQGINVQGSPFPGQLGQYGQVPGQFVQGQIPNQLIQGGQVPSQFFQNGQYPGLVPPPGQIISGGQIAGQVFPGGQIPQGIPIGQLPAQLPGQPVQVVTPPTVGATVATAAPAAPAATAVPAAPAAAAAPAATTG